MLSLSPTLSFFIYTPSSIPSTLFTLYSPLYSTFNTPSYSGLPGYSGYRVTGLLGLPGYSGCRVTRVTHLPTTCRLSLFTHLIFILHPCLYSPLLTLLITPLTYHFPFIILSFILPRHYFPYSSSPISIYSRLYSPPNLLFNILSITHLLTLLNSPLYIPNYLLTSLFPQLTFIYSKLLKLLTYFIISSTHLYIFSLTPTSLTYLILILFSISYPTLLPLLLSPLPISLSHQNFTYPYIHNPTNSFIITKNITPKILFISFLLFSIPYFQLKLHPLLLYFIFIFY